MVIVIISRGIFNKPIIPNIKNAAIKFGTTPIKDNVKFLKRIKNIIKIPVITKPKVKIWDLNKLCNKLLNKINTPASLNSDFSKPNFDSKSEFIFFIKLFLLISGCESFILKLILAWFFSIDM